MIQKFQAKIIKIKDFSEDTKKFILEVPDSFNFKAGQYVLLEGKIDRQIQRRAYSIASSPDEKGIIELCIKKIAPNRLANELLKLGKNSKVNVIGPAGKFILGKNPEKSMVFISVGTGVAPFKSMIKYLLKNLKFKKEIILIHGYRNKKDVLYKKDFEELEKEFPNFRQHIILSKPEKHHVQDVIENLIENLREKDFYICGMKEMISEVEDKLISLNVKQNQIFLERYD